MSDTNGIDPGADADVNHASQAEGEDPQRPADAEVQPAQGAPSQAEGEDPEHEDPHEVLEP